MSINEQTLLKLVRLAIGTEGSFALPSGIDWPEVVALSYRQGVPAIAVDGLQRVYDAVPNLDVALDSPELEDLKYEWFGNCLSCEQDFAAHEASVARLAEFYSAHGLRMLLLKGYGLSLNYPVPSHRPMGDVDVYLFGEWERADRCVAQELGVAVDASHEHHTVFPFEGTTVENHYDIINTKQTRSARGIDAELKRLAAASSVVSEGGFLLPTADFNAIFLIRHLGQHIAGECVTLRQLLDWGLFVRLRSEEIDWAYVGAYWEKIGIARFARAINTICVSALGIDAEKFHGELSTEGDLCDRLLGDILRPEFGEECGRRTGAGASRGSGAGSGAGAGPGAFRGRRFSFPFRGRRGSGPGSCAFRGCRGSLTSSGDSRGRRGSLTGSVTGSVPGSGAFRGCRGSLTGSLTGSAAFRVRRFFANGWKRRLVYKEGLLESFITGALAKAIGFLRGRFS